MSMVYCRLLFRQTDSSACLYTGVYSFYGVDGIMPSVRDQLLNFGVFQSIGINENWYLEPIGPRYVTC